VDVPTHRPVVAAGFFAASQLAVFARPTFKATYSGLLKLFLEQFDSGTGLAGVVAVPVMLGAGSVHADGTGSVDGAPAWIEGTVETSVPAGDHHVVLVRIHRIATRADAEPLVFHGSRFRRLHTDP
jgi:flavin reductase like protein